MGIILGVTGNLGSGKDTVADYLVEKHGCHKIVLSDLMRKELRKRGLGETKQNMALLGDELRQKFGQGIIGERAAKKIMENNWEKVVVAGFRSLEETKPIKALADSFILGEVRTPKNTRFSRREEADPQKETEFFARDKRDLENKGLKEVIEAADFHLDNSGSLEELFGQVERTMEKL